MYSHSANCDIYIGTGAGKQLLSDIGEARKSVKIVSPYLSPFLVKELISLRQRNLDVELITSDKIEDYKSSEDKNIYKLLRQNWSVDDAAIAQRQNWRKTAARINYASVGLLIATIICGIYIEHVWLFYGFFPVLFSILLAEQFRRKIRGKRIYTYHYSQLFPFRVLMSYYSGESNGTTIHSKMYIIDNKIAYLGSLNFTANGTRFNHETRIRTEDPEAIGNIQAEFNELMHSNLPEKNIQDWGRELYTEPIN